MDDDSDGCASYWGESISEEINHSPSVAKSVFQAKPDKLKDKTKSTDLAVQPSADDQLSGLYEDDKVKMEMSMSDLALSEGGNNDLMREKAALSNSQATIENVKKVKITQKIKNFLGIGSETKLKSRSQTDSEAATALQSQDLSLLEENEKLSAEILTASASLLQRSSRKYKRLPQKQAIFMEEGDLVSGSSAFTLFPNQKHKHFDQELGGFTEIGSMEMRGGRFPQKDSDISPFLEIRKENQFVCDNNVHESQVLPLDKSGHTAAKQGKQCQIIAGMIPALDGYPTVSRLCRMDRHNQLAMSAVPGLKLNIPASCITDDVTVTLTVYYADPPYNDGKTIEQHDSDVTFIQLSPIVRLEPDGYQFAPNSHSKVSLQLPVYYVDQLAPYDSIDQNLNIPIQICCRRSDENEEWQVQDLKYQYCHDQSGSYCIRFTINHFSDYVVYSYFKTTIASITKQIFPTYQQRINVFAFLSEVDTSNDSVHLKLILARKDEDEKKVVKEIDQAFTKTRLATTGLENMIIQNGQYQATFKERALDCLDVDFTSQTVFIDWNEYIYHSLDYICKIVNSKARDMAQIYLKPSGQQNDATIKCCFLTKMSSSKEPLSTNSPPSPSLPPSSNHNVGESTDDPAKYFYDVASKIHNDWRKLANKLDHKIDIYEIEADHSGVYDRAYHVLYKWKQNNHATIDQLVEALRSIHRLDIADMIIDMINK